MPPVIRQVGQVPGNSLADDEKKALWNDIVDITVRLLLSTFAVHLLLGRLYFPHSAQYDPHIKAKSREIEYNENDNGRETFVVKLFGEASFSHSQNVSAIIVNFNFWLFLC